MKITRKYSCETILLRKYSEKQIKDFVRENCTWFDEFSRTGDPRLWGSPLKTVFNTSSDLLVEGNEIRISPSGWVKIVKDGCHLGEGVLHDTSAGDDYIIIKL